jgi:hypothetical protein
MRNRIPEVTEAAVIEDFYQDLTTRPSSEPYCRKHRPPPNNCFEKQTSTSPLTSGPRTSSGERNLHHRHRDATRTSNPTGIGRRGLVRRSMPPDHPLLVPEGHPMEASRHWTTSSTPSAHTTRTCATPCGTAETSSIPSRMADHSSLYRLPHHEEGLASPGSLSNKKGEGVGHSHALTGRSMSSLEDTGRRRIEGSKSSMTVGPGGNHQCSSSLSVVGVHDHLQSSGSMANFDHPGKYPLLVDPVIRESRVKKVLVDGGSNINVTFPRTLLGLGSHSKTSPSQTPISSALCQPKESTRSGTSTCPSPLELRKTTEPSS